MSLFAENDVRLLDKTLIIREQLIDNLIKNPLPTSPRDLEAFTNLLESVDRSILAKAKIKVDENANKTNEENRQLLKGLLIELHTNPAEVGVINIEPNSNRKVPEYQSVAIEVNPGELISGTDNINLESITK